MILSAYESKEGILTVITALLGLKKQDVETVYRGVITSHENKTY